MTRRDWSRESLRAKQRRFGRDAVDTTPPLLAKPPRRRPPPSKAQLRAEAERALAQWTARRPWKRRQENAPR
jgi:hypothetical protein